MQFIIAPGRVFPSTWSAATAFGVYVSPGEPTPGSSTYLSAGGNFDAGPLGTAALDVPLNGDAFTLTYNPINIATPGFPLSVYAQKNYQSTQVFPLIDGLEEANDKAHNRDITKVPAGMRNTEIPQFMVEKARNRTFCPGQTPRDEKLTYLQGIAEGYRKQIQEIRARTSDTGIGQDAIEQEAKIYENLLNENLKKQAELQ
jgi:hypothetical protein